MGGPGIAYWAIIARPFLFNDVQPESAYGCDVRIHLRLVVLLVAIVGVVGMVLAATVWDTDETVKAPAAGATGSAPAVTGSTQGGAVGELARAIPQPINGPLLGVNLTAYTSEGYTGPNVEQGIQTLADLGSTAITLVPTWYMKKAGSNLIAPDPEKSPTDESLLEVIRWVREAGMAVVLKPHVDVLDETYRGEIDPRNRNAWYRSYAEFIDHYASIATSESAELFVIGTELKTMSTETGRWDAISRAVRNRYPGPITYAANWDEVDQVQFWDELDAIGADAYYPLSPDDGSAPTLKSLVGAWRQVASELKSISQGWERPIILTEVGYPSQVGGTAKPYEVTDKPADQNIQALAYEATFNALSGSDWLEGISWWSWRADPGDGEDPTIDYTPEGKKAQGQLAAGQFTYIG